MSREDYDSDEEWEQAIEADCRALLDTEGHATDEDDEQEGTA